MSTAASEVLFHRIRRRLNRGRIRALAGTMSRQVAGGRGFTCLVAGDAALRRLNRDFLGRDYPADVLAFPARGVGFAACGRPSGRSRGRQESRGLEGAPARRPDPLPPSLGDIAVSVPRAVAQARRLGHSLEDEIGILMLHGLLHLMGFDHERDRGSMVRRETGWRRALGLPAGLTERGRP